MKFKLIALAIAFLCLQACAVGPQYKKLPDETRKSINKAELYQLVVQDEVDFTFAVSNATGAMGGGLLWAVVDSSVNKGRARSALDVIRPLHDVSEDVDFRTILGKAIYDSLTGVLPLTDSSMQTASPLQLTNDQLKKRVQMLQPGEAFVHLDSRYLLTADFKTLEAVLGAQLYTPAAGGKKSSGMPKPAYFNMLKYQSEMIGDGGDASVAMWAKDDAALLQAKLLEASKNLADLLITDMQNIADPNCSPKKEWTMRFNSGAGLTPIKGQTLKVVGDRVYLRQKGTNWVYSLLNNKPDDVDNTPKSRKATQKKSLPAVSCP
jgi:hypothetical protein